jgi:hypothetical protein
MKRAQSDVKLLLEDRDAVVSDAERIRAFFNEHDTDKTGSLDKQQFGRLLASSGMTAQKASASVDKIFAVVDTDGNGGVSFSEWNAWQMAQNRARKSGQGKASAEQTAAIADKDRRIKELEELLDRLQQPQEATEGQVARREAVWPG